MRMQTAKLTTQPSIVTTLEVPTGQHCTKITKMIDRIMLPMRARPNTAYELYRTFLLSNPVAE